MNGTAAASRKERGGPKSSRKQMAHPTTSVSAALELQKGPPAFGQAHHSPRAYLSLAFLSIEDMTDSKADVPATDVTQGEAKAGPSKLSKDVAEASAMQPSSHRWQAIWSPSHNAYYFYNADTGETTWTNPLADSSSSSALTTTTSATTTEAAVSSEEELAQRAGIDPDLAFLDPGLYASQLAAARATSSSAGAYASQGIFDKRTGRFRAAAAAAAAVDPSAASTTTTEDPSSSAIRAKRQLGEFLDVDAWQQAKEQERLEESSDKRQRPYPSKKEVAQFKERKKERKRAKMGWLHS